MLLNGAYNINSAISDYLRTFKLSEESILLLYDKIDSDELYKGFTDKHLAVNNYYIAFYIMYIYSIDNIYDYVTLVEFIQANQLEEVVDYLKCNDIDLYTFEEIYTNNVSTITLGIGSITHGVQTSFMVQVAALWDYIYNVRTLLDIASEPASQINIADIAARGRYCTLNYIECYIPPFNFNSEYRVRSECDNVCCS